MRALFILPSVDASVGRHFTHVALSRKDIGPTTVAAFVRGGDSTYIDGVDTVLGRLDRNILARLPVYKKAIDRLVDLVRAHDVLFVYTLDTFVFASLARVAAKKEIKLVYCLTDIRPGFLGSTSFSHITRNFLLYAFKQAEVVVVTSKYYVEDFARVFLGEEPERWIEIENRVDVNPVHHLPHTECRSDFSEQIVIGYFGLIRCQRSLDVLNAASLRAGGRLKILLRGIFTPDIRADEIITDNPWMSYQGTYRNPEDLSEIYGACDLIWACYPYDADSEGNHRWAKTNRFYESGYFRKPIVASYGTKDAEYVAANGLGPVIDLSDADQAASDIVAIDQSRMGAWASKLDTLPASEFIYTDEFERLYHLLCEVKSLKTNR